MKTTYRCILSIILITLVTSNHPGREVLNLIEGHPMKQQFKLWHYALKKPYDLNSEEALGRYKVFKKNRKMIEEVNGKNLGYTLGLGPFSDYTFEEFQKSHLTYKPKIQNSKRHLASNTVDFDKMADEIDRLEITSNGKYTAEKEVIKESKDWSYLFDYVKDQGVCGSCWAFSTAGTMEAFAAKQNKKLRLSEQQLVDCVAKNEGCDGGGYEEAYEYLASNGLTDEKQYPYTSGVFLIAGKCVADTKKPVFQLKKYQQCSRYNDKISKCDTDSLMREYLLSGPYSSSIEVTEEMMHYKEGFLHDEKKKCKTPNHAVMVVHVNESQVKIRNSWGMEWGQSGYGFIKRKEKLDKDELNACGLLDEAHQPIEVSLNSE